MRRGAPVAVVALALAALAPPRAARAQEVGAAQQAEAQARFTQGLELAEHGDFARALTEFRGSLAAYNSPNTRLYVARCLAQLGRRAEAADEYDRTAREAAAQPPRVRRRYAETRTAAAAELRELEPRLGRLRVSTGAIPPEARVRVGGRELDRAALAGPVHVEPGEVTVAVEAEGYEPARATASVSPGGEASVALPALRARESGGAAVATSSGGGGSGDATEPPPSSTAPPAGARPFWPDALAITGGAVAVAGFVSFGVLYAVTNQHYQDLYAQCGGMRCPPEQLGAVEQGQALQAATNVMLGVGIVGAVFGTSMFIYARLQRPGAHAAPAPQSGESVQVGVSSNGLSVRGVF